VLVVRVIGITSSILASNKDGFAAADSRFNEANKR
jgi:hypothetical protein